MDPPIGMDNLRVADRVALMQSDLNPIDVHNRTTSPVNTSRRDADPDRHNFGEVVASVAATTG
jgi:hypothetical protein